MSFGSPKVPSVPPPPPPPNPGTPASASAAGANERAAAATAEGAGLDSTIANQGGAQGITDTQTARKQLTGQ